MSLSNTEAPKMPYFVYKITEGATALVKNLDKLGDFENYKDAKIHARELRPGLVNEKTQVKVIFAENVLAAEEMLMVKRDQPIIQEWEK